MVLQESMQGTVVTVFFVCVCISQASANSKTSPYSLDFGKEFARLNARRKLAYVYACIPFICDFSSDAQEAYEE